MEVICFEKEAFYALLKEVVRQLKDDNIKEEKWLNTEQAMAKLKIKSRTTLQKLRDQGNIRFSQPEKKWIVYDAHSIDEYFEINAKTCSFE